MSLQADPVPQPPQVRLDYAPAPPRHRKYIRRGGAMILLAAFTFAVWRWGATVRDRAVMLYTQHRCMTWSPPHDMVVYEEEPAAAARLLLRGPEYSPCALNRSSPQKSSAAFTAAAYAPTWPQIGMFMPELIVKHLGPPPALMFLHERISPSGHRRLVSVIALPQDQYFTPAFIDGHDYISGVIVPGALTADPKRIPKFWDLDVISGYPAKPPNVRIYAGQVDPNDGSKFTVRYEMWGKADVLEGQLMDDDQVKLTPRHTPDWPR